MSDIPRRIEQAKQGRREGTKVEGEDLPFSLFFSQNDIELCPRRVVNLARSNEMHILYGAGIKIPL